MGEEKAEPVIIQGPSKLTQAQIQHILGDISVTKWSITKLVHATGQVPLGLKSYFEGFGVYIFTSSSARDTKARSLLTYEHGRFNMVIPPLSGSNFPTMTVYCCLYQDGVIAQG